MATNRPKMRRSKRARWVIELPSRGEPRLFWSVPGGFHPHSQRIVAEASTTGGEIRNEQPSFLVLWVPIGTDVGLDGFLLPHDGTSRPTICALANEGIKARPGSAKTLAHLAATGIRLSHP